MWASWSQSSLFLLKECRRIHLASAVKLHHIPSLHATANTDHPLLPRFRMTRFSCRPILFSLSLLPEHQCVALTLAINSRQTLYREWRNTANPLLAPAQRLLSLSQSFRDPYLVSLHNREEYICLQTPFDRSTCDRTLIICLFDR